MLPALVVLVNKSLSEGSMEGIKSSVIDPLLKKAGLDSEIYKNFRPVNDLVFLSKLTERIVKIHMTHIRNPTTCIIRKHSVTRQDIVQRR